MEWWGPLTKTLSSNGFSKCKTRHSVRIEFTPITDKTKVVITIFIFHVFTLYFCDKLTKTLVQNTGAVISVTGQELELTKKMSETLLKDQ